MHDGAEQLNGLRHALGQAADRLLPPVRQTMLLQQLVGPPATLGDRQAAQRTHESDRLARVHRLDRGRAPRAGSRSPGAASIGRSRPSTRRVPLDGSMMPISIRASSSYRRRWAREGRKWTRWERRD